MCHIACESSAPHTVAIPDVLHKFCTRLLFLRAGRSKCDSKTNNRYNSSTIQNRGIPHGPAEARYI